MITCSVRDLTPAERAALDECLAAAAVGDLAAEEAAWDRLVAVSGRKPRRFRWTVRYRQRVNGHDHRKGR